MRVVVLIVGILVVAVGFVPLEVVFDTHSTKTTSVTTPVDFKIYERYYVLANEPATASWTSSTHVTLVARTCSSIDLTQANIWAQCTGGSNVSASGTSGTISTLAPVKGYLWVGILSPAGSTANNTASVTLTTDYQTIAIGLWGIGGILVLAGALLPRGRKRAPAVTTDQWGPSPGAEGPSAPEAPQSPSPSPEEEFVEEPPD